MTSLNLGQVVVKKEKENRQLLILWPNLLYLAVTMRRYGSLIKINPSDVVQHHVGMWLLINAIITFALTSMNKKYLVQNFEKFEVSWWSLMPVVQWKFKI